MDAKLISQHKFGNVYYARNKQETAPGWDFPFYRKGYWYCARGQHEYIGSTKAEYERFVDAFLNEM